MTIPALTEATIRQQATAESFRRGQDYHQRGCVVSLIQRGHEIQAEVEGSQYEPYRVYVAFDERGITAATCSCPYDWGGWCKHIVAVLLTCLHEPDTLEARPPLAEVLAGLDREQLQAVLLNLAAGDPDLTTAIESQVVLLTSAPAAPPTLRSRQTPVESQSFRRQVRAILHSLDHMRRSEAYWYVGSVVDQVRQLLTQVDNFIAAGDGPNALVILEAITDEYLRDWTTLDDSDGEAGGFFEDLGTAWTEALLVADLTPAERRAWARKLAEWQAELSDYGLEETFAMAQAAAEQGWDYPPLQRVLQGEITEQGAWEGEAPWYADDLALARLAILERQGRYQEYLHLAQAEGQIEQYVVMLARLGRVQEAVDEGLRYLDTPDQTLALAQALRERGELAAALRVAEHGLTLEGPKGALAAWASDLAASLGEPERALAAATVAFQAAPGLGAYQRVQELAGERWPALRTELLDHLRQRPYGSSAAVDIWLHEGLLDDAIATVDQGASYADLERVMDAVVAHRPDWVIQTAQRQAERIMDAGQAKYYHHAVGWLERARAAYCAAGREAEWRAYLHDLRARHGRKYKLMGLLDRFGH